MPRFFTLQQAQDVLPGVVSLLTAAVSAKRTLDSASADLMDLRRHVIAMGGVRPDPSRALALKHRRDSAATELQRSMEAFENMGVQVKDLDTGLIDFPTLYHGREVLLCYRLGETGIAHWHSLEGGFAGRRPIDREFIDNHEGGDEE